MSAQPAKKKASKPKVAPKLPDTQPAPKKAAAQAKKGSVDLKSIIEQGGDAESLEDALVQHLSA
jgi:hypothetical protein